jgi:murein L,D-transpeptidase YcbB/YkuD
VFDDITEFMVRRAQALHGLTVDGVYGPATHRALLAEAINKTPSNEGCFA